MNHRINNQKQEIILGIDPGLTATGYGVIQVEGSRYNAIDYGCVSTTTKEQFKDRLEKIFKNLNQVISKYQPHYISIEDLFFCKNPKSALLLGHARGVAIVCAGIQKIPLFEYAPRQVKQSVIGYGAGSKEQVQEMVKLILNLPKIPRPHHAADALAVAICCANDSLKNIELK